MKGKEEEYVDLCVICLVNAPDAQIRPCGHSMICRDCTRGAGDYEYMVKLRALAKLCSPEFFHDSSGKTL
ncbi:hypothetical protein TL16_g12605 [Triparma laevis f. inornata]|uniref:RING-type domain-containing protein n=1 Tax=Triparma laevis f. inornata TaxID=1714386 RepID=A0A9W7EWY7_9STRA|nr:hypothetical protein TL16_g12605 [Triparma laevis f. inornata]